MILYLRFVSVYFICIYVNVGETGVVLLCSYLIKEERECIEVCIVDKNDMIRE
jgi:hypothetical protein